MIVPEEGGLIYKTMDYPAIVGQCGACRYLPSECERLVGVLDGYTRIPKHYRALSCARVRFHATTMNKANVSSEFHND